jgi:hypothetical protein
MWLACCQEPGLRATYFHSPGVSDMTCYTGLLALLNRGDPAWSAPVPPVYAVTCRKRKVGRGRKECGTTSVAGQDRRDGPRRRPPIGNPHPRDGNNRYAGLAMMPGLTHIARDVDRAMWCLLAGTSRTFTCPQRASVASTEASNGKKPFTCGSPDSRDGPPSLTQIRKAREAHSRNPINASIFAVAENRREIARIPAKS